MTLNPTNISIIKRLLGGKNNRPLRGILSKIEAADLARLFSHFNYRESNLFIEALISMDKASDVLRELPEQQLYPVLKKMEKSKLIVLLNYSPLEDSAYFLNCLGDEYTHYLELLDDKRIEKLKQLLDYPEESAGRLMMPNAFNLPANISCAEATEKLRQQAQEESIYYIYCTDNEQRLVGVVSLRELVTAPASKQLNELNTKQVITVSPYETEEEVAQLVDKYGFIAIPVVDDDHRLLGIITVDEVLEIIQDQATADIYASAGLQEDDRVYSPAIRSIKNRLPWMCFNLILASYVSSVVSLFESVMSEAIVLATLNNIVAGMGGNTGIQTLTVFTRGIARGDFQFTNYRKAISKEALVGLVNGCITGILAGILVYFWKGSAIVGSIICISMILNALVASTLGSSVPLLLKKLNFDPAAGSGVLITMITDSFGFFSFLGIATLVLKYVGHL